MINYYNILGVNKTASSEEIKKAYRNLARKYHPDLHQGNALYENKMKDLNEAASILLDEGKRTEYDYLLEAEREKLRKAIIVSPPPPVTHVYYPPKKGPKPYDYGYTHQNSNSLTIMIWLFIVMSVIAIAVITIGIYQFFLKPESGLVPTKPEYLDFGLTRDQVVLLLGEPKEETSHLMVYDDYEIIIYMNKVDGWLDASGTLNVGDQKMLDLDKVKVGTVITQVIAQYGNPDSYSKEMAIYNNVVLYLTDGKVSKIQQIE